MAKFGKVLLVSFGCLAILIGAGWYFHASLLRAGFNALLNGDTTVTRVEGVQLSFSRAAIAGMELSLGPGRQLTITGIEVDYMMRGLFKVPVVQNLTVASARLTDIPRGGAEISGSAPDENGAVAQTGLLLSELLRQLRDFPLERLALQELQMPQFRQQLSLHAEQQADVLDIRIATGGLQLRAGFSQAGVDAAGQFELTLQADGQVLAQMDVSLTPAPSGYQLAGNGNVTIPDANTTFAEYLTKPLPVADIALEWDVAAAISDDLAAGQPSIISVGVAPASSFTLSEGLMPDLGELAVVVPQRAELNLAPGADMRVTGMLPLQLSGAWRQQSLRTTLTVTPAECLVSSTLECSLGFDAIADLDAYALSGADSAATTTVEKIAFSGSGNVQIDAGSLAIELMPGASLGSALVTAPAYAFGPITLANDTALRIGKTFAATDIVIAGEQVAVTVTQLNAGAYSTSGTLAVRDIDLRLADAMMGRLNVQIASLAVSGPQWLPLLGIDADIAIDDDTLSFSTPLQLQNLPTDAEPDVAGSYDLASGAAQFSLRLPALTMSGEGKSLSSYLGGWPYDADLMTGTLALELDVDLLPAAAAADAQPGEPVIRATTKIELADVAGFYVENFVRGLNATITATYDSSLPSLPVTIPPSTLTLTELNVGLPLTDITLDYALDSANQTVHVNSLSAKALDGTITGTDISYDLGKDVNEFNLAFTGLQLERMMELAEYEGIEANGAVSGNLPITIREGQVEIAAGRLYAEAPGGSIRYLDAPPAGGNPAMDLVNQALSNYQFQSLESTIDYAPDGELLLAMQLRGNNPDMNGGQAINLNLNISDNIPTLLKSLQAGRAIEDFLQEQYK